MAEFVEKDFLKEAPLDPVEKQFIVCLLRNRADKAARAAYADWLLEQGRTKSAKAVRDGYTPGYGWWVKTAPITHTGGFAATGFIDIPQVQRRGLSSGGW